LIILQNRLYSIIPFGRSIDDNNLECPVGQKRQQKLQIFAGSINRLKGVDSGNISDNLLCLLGFP
jgi:hypothetical protein